MSIASFNARKSNFDPEQDESCVKLINIHGHSILYPHLPSSMEEVNQNLPPKKSKIKSADTCPLRNYLNSLFPSEKAIFFSKPPGKYSKDQRRRRSDPLGNDDQGPLRKSLPSGGVDIKWNGPMAGDAQQSKQRRVS